MLDNLIRLLPGVRLDENGRITVNGEFVSTLLVNGRDFFKGDPKVALDNLPAYTVDKIKAYHSTSTDPFEKTDGAAKDEIGPKGAMVLDVRLKREYAQGWIANAEAAGGTKTRDMVDEVWLGRTFAMRYTDHSQLAVYGNVNNLGDKQSPGQKGKWTSIGINDGNKTVRTGGIDFSVDGKKTKVVFKTSLTGRHETMILDTKTSGVNYYASGDIHTRSFSRKRSSGGDLKWDASISQSKNDFGYRLSGDASPGKT